MWVGIFSGYCVSSVIRFIPFLSKYRQDLIIDKQDLRSIGLFVINKICLYTMNCNLFLVKNFENILRLERFLRITVQYIFISVDYLAEPNFTLLAGSPVGLVSIILLQQFF